MGFYRLYLKYPRRYRFLLCLAIFIGLADPKGTPIKLILSGLIFSATLFLFLFIVRNTFYQVLRFLAGKEINRNWLDKRIYFHSRWFFLLPAFRLLLDGFNFSTWWIFTVIMISYVIILSRNFEKNLKISQIWIYASFFGTFMFIFLSVFIFLFGFSSLFW